MVKSLLATFVCLLLLSPSHAQIYKCIVKGKTSYSESPCKEGDYQNNRFEVSEDRMGNVTYDRATIEGARARVRAGMNERGVGVSTGSNVPIGAGSAARNASSETRKHKCELIGDRRKSLDSWARQQHYGGYSLDWIRDQKMQNDREAYDWGC